MNTIGFVQNIRLYSGGRVKQYSPGNCLLPCVPYSFPPSFIIKMPKVPANEQLFLI